MPVALQAAADDFAGGHIERGKQRGGAVSLVIVRQRAGAALLERQSRLRTVERLDLALLVDAQDQGFVRRVEVEADNVLHFLAELRIVGQLEGLRQVWLQPMRRPLQMTQSVTRMQLTTRMALEPGRNAAG